MRSMRRVQDDIRIILTSVDDENAAGKLARGLVDARLAACVQISAKGVSVYRWQGTVQNDAEYYLSIKTSAASETQAIGWLEEHHPYDTPEIICLQGTSAEAYGAWLRNEVMPAS